MKRRLAVGVMLAGCVASCGAPAGGGAGKEGEEAGGFPPSPPVPGAGAVSAVVRNFTDQSADVTLRFSLYDITVRLTFVRVPARTSTTVVGPEVTDLLEVSGMAQDGVALPNASFRYGEDFLDGTEAVYIVGTEDLAASVPPTLIFLEPVATTEVVPGEELIVTIIDEDPDSSAVITFYLDPFEAPPDADEAGTNGAATSDGGSAAGTNGADDMDGEADAEPAVFVFVLDGDEIVLGADLAEDPDGQDDDFAFTIPDDLPLGSWRVVAVISDELSTSIVQAPGLVEVVAVGSETGDGQPLEEEQNIAPTLELAAPAREASIVAGAALTVAWTDDDADDNAAISLFLDPDDDPFNGNETVLAEAIEEDPDGDADATNLVAADVPPGTYRVVGLIDDGSITAVATAPGLVTVSSP